MYFVSFVLVLLAILWLFQTVLLGTVYRRIKTDSLKKCVGEAAYTLKSASSYDNIEELAKTYDVSIKIVDRNYETLYFYAVSPTNVVNRISNAELYLLCRKAEENSGSYVQIFQQYMKEQRREENETLHGKGSADAGKGPGMPESEDFKRGMPRTFIRLDSVVNLISTKVAKLPDGNVCYIIADSLITPVDATVHTLIVMLVYISIFTVFVAMLLAFELARRVAGPIIDINKSAMQLAKGDYSTRFEGSGYREVAQLSDTLNVAAAELSKADELRRELVANVSHDLRTPLTMIIGYSEVMRDIPGENTPENVQVIIDEATRLSSLVTDLLDISRLQSGSDKLTVTEFDLTDSIRSIIGRFDKLKESDGYRITFEYDSDVTVEADETRISQVVYNLMINAINYTGEDKSVRVVQTLVEDGKKVRVEFIDSGEGIAKEELPYIWDRYYKVDKTHKRAQMGTGLGLSIVKTALEVHGAAYGVNSVVGEGSTFWFELPTKADEASPVTEA